ncbi:MAG: glycoside hydrolase family 3 N-terminal domain-containing protein, partial [Granulosicoccaceae bacterium]
HGGVVEDTHLTDASDPRPLDEIIEHDLRVFMHLIDAGVDAVMPAHVVFPSVDDTPAGYSAKWIGDILRQELGFRGAVLSDDLTMAAAGVAGAAPERAERALQAGCDLALVCQSPSDAEVVIEQVGALATDTDRAARVAALRRTPEACDSCQQLELAQQSLHWLHNLA